MKVENNLDTDKVRGLVWRLAFPSMLAVRRADGGRHRGAHDVGFPLRQSLGPAQQRPRGHPDIIVCQLDWSGRSASHEYPSGTEK